MLSFKKRRVYKESCISIYIKQQTVLVSLNRSKPSADAFKGDLTMRNSVSYTGNKEFFLPSSFLILFCPQAFRGELGVAGIEQGRGLPCTIFSPLAICTTE